MDLLVPAGPQLSLVQSQRDSQRRSGTLDNPAIKHRDTPCGVVPVTGELLPFQTSISHEVEGLCNSASKVKRSEGMLVTFWKSVSRDLSCILKPKSEINYKKKAAKYVTDKSGQIDNIVQGDAEWRRYN